MAFYRTVTAHAKGRWIGKPLDFVAKEVNAKVSGPHEIVRDHDVLTYEVHVHEAFVPDKPIKVIYSDDKMVVIDKPSGVPTHPTVNYFSKTATELLKPKYGDLVPCYRLDRLTSGVLVLFRSGEIASNLLATRRQKKYLARVVGDFTDSVCDEPIVVFNAKRGYSAFLQAHKRAKQAYTQFTAIVKDKTTTIVQCELETGRTHQIRKHLSLLGHPIVGDDLYSDGLYNALFKSPTQENFDNVYDAYERRRLDKDTGEKCSECGATIYNDVEESIDLHCYQYEIDGRIFRSSPDWLEPTHPLATLAKLGNGVAKACD